jgi:hypothetical protein
MDCSYGHPGVNPPYSTCDRCNQFHPCHPSNFYRSEADRLQEKVKELTEERDYLLEQQGFAVWKLWEEEGRVIEDVPVVASRLMLRPSTAEKAIAVAKDLKGNAPLEES